MATDELLQAGIAAAQAGDMERAASYFADAVKTDPSSERGWMLLGMSLSVPERRAYCLRRVLALNPNNAEARKQLDRLTAGPASKPPSPRPPATIPPPAPPAAAPERAATPEDGAPERPWLTGGYDSPFLPADDSSPASAAPEPDPRARPGEASGDSGKPLWIQEAERRSSYKYEFTEPEGPEEEASYSTPAPPISSVPALSFGETLKSPAAPEPFGGAAPKKPPTPEPSWEKVSLPQRSQEGRAPSGGRPAQLKVKKPKKGGAVALILISVILLLACATGVAFLVLSGNLSTFLNPAYVPIPTALQMPTSAPAQAAGPGATSVPTPATPTPLPTPLPTVSYTPAFETSDCRFNVPQGAHVTCGYLIVPEDRSGDPTRTIRLAVAVYHSTSDTPEPEPVLFLQGGPGGAALQFSALAYASVVTPFLKQRDFIAYDQRGTGLSEPALDCPDLTKAYLQDIFGQIPADARKIVYSNAFLSCQGAVSVGGVNLNAYTTAASAADVRDLMQVLKYQQVDLYGASYGTRLAQVIMRQDPGLVHAVILDSVVPLETNFFAEYPDSIGGALKNLFQACAADAGCNAAYPNLESVFWDQLNRLNANPVQLKISNPQTGTVTGDVDGSVFLNIALISLKVSSLIDTVPQTIYRFKAGDYSAVINAQSSLPYAFEGINIGLYIEVMCHEQILRTTADQLQAALAAPASIQEYAWLPFFGDAQAVYNACKSWRANGPFLGENDPVTSDIPTLIITGKYDPTTPPQYAQLVGSHLSHSHYFEFPNQGHTPTAADSSGCALDIAVAFLRDPQAEPDGSCVNDLTPVSFLLPYTGDPPVSLEAAAPWGISAKVPRGWIQVGGGIFLREDSPFDVTQLGIFPIPGTTSADLLNWLSQKAWGYRGLDTAPAWAGQRTVNGLEWTLYTSTSDGRPADIAMTDHNGKSVVVLGFSNVDEHDAFYRTIFLPVVDSVRP